MSTHPNSQANPPGRQPEQETASHTHSSSKAEEQTSASPPPQHLQLQYEDSEQLREYFYSIDFDDEKFSTDDMFAQPEPLPSSEDQGSEASTSQRLTDTSSSGRRDNHAAGGESTARRVRVKFPRLCKTNSFEAVESEKDGVKIKAKGPAEEQEVGGELKAEEEVGEGYGSSAEWDPGTEEEVEDEIDGEDGEYGHSRQTTHGDGVDEMCKPRVFLLGVRLENKVKRRLASEQAASGVVKRRNSETNKHPDHNFRAAFPVYTTSPHIAHYYLALNSAFQYKDWTRAKLSHRNRTPTIRNNMPAPPSSASSSNPSTVATTTTNNNATRLLTLLDRYIFLAGHTLINHPAREEEAAPPPLPTDNSPIALQMYPPTSLSAHLGSLEDEQKEQEHLTACIATLSKDAITLEAAHRTVEEHLALLPAASEESTSSTSSTRPHKLLASLPLPQKLAALRNFQQPLVPRAPEFRSIVVAGINSAGLPDPLLPIYLPLATTWSEYSEALMNATKFCTTALEDLPSAGYSEREGGWAFQWTMDGRAEKEMQELSSERQYATMREKTRKERGRGVLVWHVSFFGILPSQYLIVFFPSLGANDSMQQY
ncbi:hypothetical protein Q7P37_007643 [Cladosporium fusiforme]